MFSALPTPAEMSVWDKEAAKLGLPGFTLMENASREALHVLEEHAGPLEGKRILLLMGAGNNGGDAACLARHLADAHAEPLVIHSRPLTKAKGETGRHVRLARRCGVRFCPASAFLRSPERFQPDILVDGLLGTGFSGTLRPLESELVRAANALGLHALVLALDIPSGLSGLFGRPQPEAVRANITVTFEAAKPGLILPEASQYVGQLTVRRIGIPGCVRHLFPASFEKLEPGCLDALPPVSAFSHKGKGGHVLILGGSGRFPGAPRLAAMGALRSGAGLVTLGAPEAFIDIIRGGCPDIMRLPLPGDSWEPSLLPALCPLPPRCTALAVGPGMGRSEKAADFLTKLLELPGRPPAVIDADALINLASADALALTTEHDILTPHPGEAAMLLNSTAGDVQGQRFAALEELKKLSPAVWILKGEGTLISSGNSAPTAISPYAEPNLAIGGSGDVLAGCAAALLAQGIPPRDAAKCAVLLHALAGEQLQKRFPCRGNTASDIADAIPEAAAMHRIRQEQAKQAEL